MKILNALLTLALVAIVAVQASLGHGTLALLYAAASGVVLFGLNTTAQVRASGLVCANTLTNLIPDFYTALDVVSRELVGMIPSVARDPSADRCAMGATMRMHQTRSNAAAADITPAMSIPSAADQTIDNRSFTIQKSRFAPFSWSGEQSNAVNTGPGFLTIKQDQIAQAIRALTNEIEVDLATIGAQVASRAYGTAGTTPFDSTNKLAASAQVRKILDDNGAPPSGRSLVINTTAGAAVRTLTQLTNVNESGTSMTLRDGELLNVHGLSMKESAQIYNATKGSGASYLLNGALAIGDTTVTLDTGSGTILAGDILTISNHKYVVKTALSAGSLTIEKPGIQEVVADNTAVTVNNTSARNLAFTQNAILLGTRLPALPEEGDMATDRELVTDPRSGLTFELAVYPGFRMVTYHVSIAWGVMVTKPEHIAILLG